MTFTVEGGSITVEDLGDGRAIVGDWETDGTNTHAAVSLYKKAERYCKENGLQPVVTAESVQMLSFFLDMGLIPTSVVLTTKEYVTDAWLQPPVPSQETGA